MIKKILYGAIMAGFVGMGQGFAQGIPVFDATQVARSIEQIQNQMEQLKKMESQLKEAQRLYDSFNKTGNLNDLLALLNDPRVRQYLPQDAQQLTQLLQGKNVSGLGNISNRATEIRNTTRAMLPDSEAVKANDFYYKELERIGIRTANELAIGEQIYSTATTRQQNIQKLAERVTTATDYRELANIQATILLEMASMQNELIKIQGMTIIMNAERKLDGQRELEKARQLSTSTINSLTLSLPKK